MKIEIFLNKMKDKGEQFLLRKELGSSFRLCTLLKSMFPKGRILITKSDKLFFFELDGVLYSADGIAKLQNFDFYKEPGPEIIKQAESRTEEYYLLLDSQEI